jgi:hypothetical protein
MMSSATGAGKGDGDLVLELVAGVEVRSSAWVWRT